MKKVLKMLTLLVLILTILIIGDTYAKYFSQATASSQHEIGKWVIKLNDTDIYSEDGQDVEFTITPENIETDENTMPGKISPNSTWVADIEIDPAGTDVAVRYDIEIDVSVVTDMEITYQLVNKDATKTLKRTAANTYTGIISLDEVQADEIEELTCTIKWKNDESKNEQDTAIGSIYGQQISMPVKVTCTQYLGETLPTYNP